MHSETRVSLNNIKRERIMKLKQHMKTEHKNWETHKLAKIVVLKGIS